MANKRRTVISGLVIALVSVFAAPKAEAASISISDGGAPTIIGELSPGVVNYVGNFGAWWFTVVGGLTKPNVGSATDPSMVLGLNATSNSSCSPTCTLTVMFSEQGFGPSNPAVFATSIAALVGGSVTYQTYQGATNSLFELTTLITTGDGNSEVTGALPVVAFPYSLTQVFTVTHSGTAITAATGSVNVPDGGLTLAMFGSALVGFGMLRRRFRRD